MEDKKVSVIVPVYNIALYLDECVSSLVGQTYRNLEILLIDDGSTDDSGVRCDRWAAEDDRVRVIHKVNGGAAAARNTGLDVAGGDLVCFVDSDDAAEPDYVRHLVRTLEEYRADAATCGFRFWSRSKAEIRTGDTKPGVYDREEYMCCFLLDWSCSLLWNKIFSREAIGSLRMAEGHRVDDEYFTYQVCMNCAAVAVSDRPLYRYRLRSSSVMQDMAAVQEKIMLDRVGYLTTRYGHIADRMPALEDAYFVNTLDTISRYWHHSKDMPEAQKAIRRWVKAHTGRILKLRLPLRRKLGYLRGLYLRKPAVTAEANPIQMDAQEYFD